MLPNKYIRKFGEKKGICTSEVFVHCFVHSLTARDEYTASNYRQLKVIFNSFILPVGNLAHNFQVQLK